MIRIAPSILSADFARLGDAVRSATEAGADLIHVDVMDGHFVPNLTVGPAVVEAIRRVTSLPLDVHLMIHAPDRMLNAFAAAGADSLTVHAEACPHLRRSIRAIKSLGRKAGVALNPPTPLRAIEVILPHLDLVLIMSVNPGFGGQRFIRAMLRKIAALRKMIERLDLECVISVDGGINAETAIPAVRAGAEILVAGSAIFNGEPVAHNIAAIRARALSAVGTTPTAVGGQEGSHEFRERV